MEKIISLFKRDYEGTRQVYDEVVEGAEWVQAGEGAATRKWDGTCCMVRDHVLYKRYDAKRGKQPPPGFEPAQDPDPETGHWPGWVCVLDGPEDKYFREAAEMVECKTISAAIAVMPMLPDGTYELCGPKVQGNPEGLSGHILIRHGADVLPDAPRTFYELKAWLYERGIEGIVWHHPDGRLVKIKGKDFGIKRRVLENA